MGLVLEGLKRRGWGRELEEARSLLPLSYFRVCAYEMKWFDVFGKRGAEQETRGLNGGVEI